MTLRPFLLLIIFSSSLGSIAWSHQPMASQPAVNKPMVDKPVVSKPTVGKSTDSKPKGDKPMVDKPSVGKPAGGALEEVSEFSVCQEGQKAGGQLIGRLAKAVTLTSEEPLTCQAEMVALPPPEAQGRLACPPPAPFLHLMGKVRRLPWPGVPGSFGSPGSPSQVLIQMVWVGVTSPHHPSFTVAIKEPLVSLLKVPLEGDRITLPQGFRLPLHGPWQELCQAAQRLASLTRLSKNTLSTEGSLAGGISARSVPAGGSHAGDLSASRLPAQGTEGTPSVWIATNPQSQARRVAALPALPVAVPSVAAPGGGSTQEMNGNNVPGIAANKGGESSQARAAPQGQAVESQGRGVDKGGESQLPAASAARVSTGRSFQGNPFQGNASPGRPSFSTRFPAGSYGNPGAWGGPSFGSSGFYGGAHPLFPSGTFPQAFAPGSTQGAAPAEAVPAEAVPVEAVPVDTAASQDPSSEETASPARAGEETIPAPEPSAPEHPREATTGEAASPPNLTPLGTREDPVPEPFTLPALQVRVTTQGCTPRVDLKQNRVVIQTKSVTLKEGRVIHETPCGDSHVWYLIHKDWACPDARDEKARVAYSCYRRYWEDKKDRRTYLDNTCQRDESRPHPYEEDPTPCPHKVDWDARQAYRQAQTVYYNRANVRQVVAACHPISAPPLPLVEVRYGCKPLHYFEQNLSVIQKRTLFHDAGQDYEVLPCSPTLETVPHVFVKGGCTSTFVDGHFQGFGKRQIILEGKKTLITDTCEPLPSEHIQATLDGCEGQWEQDFEAGRCYQKVRWYYNAQGHKKFLTGCLRGTLFYPHRLEIGTYEHDDRNRRSKPVYKVFFEKDGKQHYVTLYGETDPKKFIAHIYQGEFSFVSHTTVYSNQDHLPGQLHPHSASMQVWLRPDGSTYHVR